MRFFALICIFQTLGCSQSYAPLSSDRATSDRLTSDRLSYVGSLPLALKYLSEKKISTLFIYFYSSSCVPCRIFEQKVLNDQIFKTAFADIPIVKVQIDGSVAEMTQSIKFGVRQTPTFFVMQAHQQTPTRIPLSSRKECGITCIDLTSLIYQIKQIIRVKK